MQWQLGGDLIRRFRAIVCGLAGAFSGVAGFAEGLDVANVVTAAPCQRNHVVNSQSYLRFGSAAARAAIAKLIFQALPLLGAEAALAVALASAGSVLDRAIGVWVILAPSLGSGAIFVSVQLAPCGAAVASFLEMLLAMLLLPFGAGPLLCVGVVLMVLRSASNDLLSVSFVVLAVLGPGALFAARVQAVLVDFGAHKELWRRWIGCAAFGACFGFHMGSIAQAAH